MTRRINQAGVAIVKEHEGCRLTSYLCPAGIWTIGYGSTREVTAGMTITQDQADGRLLLDLAGAGQAVASFVKVILTDNQFSALVSFVFNVGSGHFAKSTLLEKLNAGNYAAVPDELNKWRRGGGKVLDGLVVRRAAEGELFNQA